MHPPYRSHTHFFFHDPAATDIYALSLHDALPICTSAARSGSPVESRTIARMERLPPLYTRQDVQVPGADDLLEAPLLERKSTRLNSSHANIWYAGFGLKKKRGRLLTRCDRKGISR